MNHFTDPTGYDGIRATHPTWTVRAAQPPGDHPRGAYFTTLGRETRNLAARLRIPRAKLARFFAFQDAGDLIPIRGDRGRWILYSPNHYPVTEDRHQDHGETGL